MVRLALGLKKKGYQPLLHSNSNFILFLFRFLSTFFKTWFSTLLFLTTNDINALEEIHVLHILAFYLFTSTGLAFVQGKRLHIPDFQTLLDRHPISLGSSMASVMYFKVSAHTLFMITPRHCL